MSDGRSQVKEKYSQRGRMEEEEEEEEEENGQVKKKSNGRERIERAEE